MQYDQIKNLYHEKNFTFLEREFECNLFGIRAKNPVLDQFGCKLGVAYKDSFGNGVVVMLKGSTLPGLYYLKKKLGNIQGTSILCLGQHLHCWILGYHHAGTPEQYPAWQQSGPLVFKVFRDNNSDGKLDIGGQVYTNVSGLNGHHAADKNLVGPYSAGCQVAQDKEEHKIWIAPGYRHVELYGNSFHYALFQES